MSPRSLVLGWVALALGCSDTATDVPVEQDVLAELRAACGELAAVECAHHQRCLPLDFDASYADLANCNERRADLCEDTRFGDGSPWQPADLVACADAQKAWSDLPLAEHCSTWLRSEATRVLPAPCQRQGSLADGESCLRGDQCMGGRCARRLVGECGACSVPAAADEPCLADSDCPLEHACHEGACTLFGGIPGALAPCLPELGTDSDGLCVDRLPVGASCDPSADECARWPEELACSPASSTCEPLELGGAGKACGGLEQAGPVKCSYGLGCRLDHPDGSRCVDLLLDGKSCALSVQGGTGEWLGGPCFAPASCIDFHCGAAEAASCTGAHPP